jgi:hypothetical protein
MPTRQVQGQAREQEAEQPRPATRAAADVLWLQRAAGNRAVEQLIARTKTAVLGAKSERETLMDELETNPARRRKLAYIPSTKMGRFDAEYLPSKGKLVITVRPHLTWFGPWTNSEKRDFEKKFVKQVQKAWSGKHQFTCTKYGYQDIVVTPEVRCELAPSVATAHFDITVNHVKAGDTMIKRESYSNPTAISTGQFAREDAPVRPHDNPRTRCSLALHEVDRIKMFLTANGVAEITFRPDGELTTAAWAGLKGFIKGMERTALPSAAKVPIIATGYDTAAERGGGTRPAKKRLEKVKAALAPITKRHPVTTRTIDELIGQEESARDKAIAGYERMLAADAGAHDAAMNKGFYRRGGAGHTAADTHITKLKAGQDTARVTLEADEKWANAYKDTDPYSILAHEFGHMLGNPDEYFGWGPEGLDNKIAQLLSTGNASDAQEAVVLQAQKGQPNINMNDAERRDIQDRFTALVNSAGERIPTMTQKGSGATSSIMNAGAEVQRAHYVTLLEALAEITKPTLTMSDWKIL